VTRYKRQIAVPAFGAAGQARLGAARVLVVGAGGLAAPVLQYLVAAGVGRIVLADPDTVDLSNLHRQTLFREADIGQPKVDAAARHMAALNPGCAVAPQRLRLAPDTVAALAEGVDLALDCADSFAASYILSDHCHARGVPLVSASVLGLSGYCGGFCGGAPSLRAVFPDLPQRMGSCAEDGVLGPVVGVVGALQAQMALAILSGATPGREAAASAAGQGHGPSGGQVRGRARGPSDGQGHGQGHGQLDGQSDGRAQFHAQVPGQVQGLTQGVSQGQVQGQVQGQAETRMRGQGLALMQSPLGRIVTFDAADFRFGGFRFDAAPEPADAPGFVAGADLRATDFIVDLREAHEAPLAHPGARRLRVEALGAGGPVPDKGQRAVLCCRSGLRSWQAAARLRRVWPGEIVLAALHDTDHLGRKT
jgi:molybdopterin/thiamine biosynthesis adenylyltransferase